MSQLHNYNLLENYLEEKELFLWVKILWWKKAISLHEKENPKLIILKELLKGNIGLIFTNDNNLKELRDLINSKTRDAPAKAGQVSPGNVVIPAQNTGIEPTKNIFFSSIKYPN